MIARIAKRELPRSFRNHSAGKQIVFEKDIAIGTSRLRLKLLVFTSRAVMRKFWKQALHKSDLGRDCDGVVNGLNRHVMRYGKSGALERQWLEVDRRYFAVMGIVQRRIASAEVTAHEAVHAGYAYAKRIRRSPWDDQVKMFDEEAVAYPAGEIARALAEIYWKHFAK